MVAVADVARVAGVSTATVSRVLNGHPSVRGETRVRVEAAMRELNYRLSFAARSLRTSQTRMVLALVPDIANPYYAEIVRGLGAAAREHDHELLLCDTGVSEARERAVAQMLTRRMYDGVVCMDPFTTQRMVSEEVSELPWVACSEFVPDAKIPHVSIDHRVAAKDAVLYLLAKGHRRIALINSDERYLYAQQRREGYRDALREAGLPERAPYMQVVGGIDPPLGELAARRLLALEDAPSAVFAVADTLAVGAIKAALAAGRQVPGDLAVVGFDDVPLASIFEPSLTTVAQPRRELGRQSMLLLLKRMAGEMPESVTLPHAMVERRSA
jgi:LacI family transcriptional regulator, repressor for deo operon, udp, cdd, tsx, nupC, and nupG